MEEAAYEPMKAQWLAESDQTLFALIAAARSDLYASFMRGPGHDIEIRPPAPAIRL
jgi:hypothetical protein